MGAACISKLPADNKYVSNVEPTPRFVCIYFTKTIHTITIKLNEINIILILILKPTARQSTLLYEGDPELKRLKKESEKLTKNIVKTNDDTTTDDDDEKAPLNAKNTTKGENHDKDIQIKEKQLKQEGTETEKEKQNERDKKNENENDKEKEKQKEEEDNKLDVQNTNKNTPKTKNNIKHQSVPSESIESTIIETAINETKETSVPSTAENTTNLSSKEVSSKKPDASDLMIAKSMVYCICLLIIM